MKSNRPSRPTALLGTLLVWILFSSLPAQNRSGLKWISIDTARTYPETESILSAKQKTIAFARQCALQKAVPEKVAITSLLSDYTAQSGAIAEEQTAYSIFALSSIAGYITDQEIEALTITPIENQLIECHIKLKAAIEPTTGERNPAIALELELKENYLHDGEQLQLQARPSVDGYLYLFDFMADNTVLLMFPNEYSPDSRLTAHQWQKIPSPKDTYRFIVHPLPDREMTTETIYGVFCVNPIAGIEQFKQVQKSDRLPGYILEGDSFTEFQKWLARVPLSQRTEQALKIIIVK